MNDHDSQKTRSRIRPGYTLTELLVVILIVAVLASLTFVGVRRVRDVADKATAVRNLAQLQIANANYSTDNSGKYVPYIVNDENGNRAGYWYQVPEFLNYFRGEVADTNGPQSKSVPLSMLDPKVVRAKADSFYKSMAGSYGLNRMGLPSVVGIADARPSYTVNTVSKPELSMAFASATDVRIEYASRFNWRDVEGKTSDGGLAYRHGKKALVVYFDGHVGEVSKGDIKEIDSSRGGSKSNFWLPNAK